MSLTYGTYLKLDALLTLQEPLSAGPEHDETLFIVVHQVYELWFKQILHELARVQTAFSGFDPVTVRQGLKRVLTILKTLVSQVDILETMSPISFGSFRARLDTSSGFQSVQFREVEILLGQRRQHWLEVHPAGSPARALLEERCRQPSLYDAFLQYLAVNGFAIPSADLARDYTQTIGEFPQVQTVLIDIYRHHPDVMQICELLVDLDEGLQEWRYRHVKMVERTIGGKSGSGGSAGAAYLKSTLFKPLFPDLWVIRQAL